MINLALTIAAALLILYVGVVAISLIFTVITTVGTWLIDDHRMHYPKGAK